MLWPVDDWGCICPASNPGGGTGTGTDPGNSSGTWSGTTLEVCARAVSESDLGTVTLDGEDETHGRPDGVLDE